MDLAGAFVKKAQDGLLGTMDRCWAAAKKLETPTLVAGLTVGVAVSVVLYRGKKKKKVEGGRGWRSPRSPTVTLASGHSMPVLALGTWKSPTAGATATAVETAIKAGYRNIDAANDYNNEHEVGEAIAKCIAEGVVTREELQVAGVDLYSDRCRLHDASRVHDLNITQVVFSSTPLSGQYCLC